MITFKKNKRKAFTLIEALAASTILAGAMIAVSALSSRCLSRARLNRQYDLAWQLLDRQFTLIDYMGIDKFLEQGITSGKIEQPQGEYYWNVNVSSEYLDNLYEITLTIRWLDGKKIHSVYASTRFNGQVDSLMFTPTEI